MIGTGWWGTNAHLPALLEREDTDIVALADRDVDRLRTASRAFDVDRTYTDYVEMLECQTLDGVVVAASHAVHYEAVKAALEHGCHVLAEKPLALNSAHAHDLVEIAAQRGLSIVMSCPWGFTPHALQARDAILSGRIGMIRLVNSLFTSFAGVSYYGDPEPLNRMFDADFFEGTLIRTLADANIDLARGGGQGWCQVSHSAALTFWVTGLTAARVSAYMNCAEVDVDMVDAISMTFSNGAIGVMSSTGDLALGDEGHHALHVFGSDGYLILDVIAGTLLIKSGDAPPRSYDPLPSDERYPRAAPADNLVDIILHGAANHGPGDIGCAAVDLIDAAHRSAAAGGTPMTVAP